MTDTTTENLPPDVAYQGDDHETHGDHPTEKQYWVVFAILAVVTALEVLWSYLGLSGPALVLPLMVMMVGKFFAVAAYFMHLKYDLSIVNGRTFALMFAFGLVTAVAVYFVVFATFEFQI